jgi:DNA-binding response OmpR family regulator
MPHLLVVEDEPTLRHLLMQNLVLDGFSVEALEDGDLALASISRQRPDLMVLDLMLPRVDGFQVLERLRQQGDTLPVLMLTARGAEADRLQGLRMGADDYIVKPFSILELIARIRAILRRTAPALSPSLRTGPFRVNRLKNQVYLRGQSLNLTALEFRLLEILAGSPGIPCSREELIHLAWGEAYQGSKHTLNVHIANLRKKLAEAGPEDFILTVGRVGRGGYCWVLPVQPEVQG